MGALTAKSAVKWLCIGVVCALLFMLGFVGVRAYLASGGYEFRTQSIEGEKRLSDFKGQYVLVYFGYTSCPDICPLGLSEIGSALEELDSQKVRLLFITLDPARDDVASVDKYVKHFYPASYGLRLEEPALRELAARYGVKYEKIALKDSALGYAVAHSSAVFVFDENGTLVEKISNITKEEIEATLSNATKPRIVCGEFQDSKGVSESSLKNSEEVLESRSTSESIPSDSYPISESAIPVIASVAKQSTDSEKIDCRADKSARNDNGRDSKSGDSNARLALSHNDKASQPTESKPTDSESPHITQRANTPLLLIFTSAHCRSCEQLTATISSSPRLTSALHRGIDTYTIDERTPSLSRTLNTQSEQNLSARELARHFQVRGTPTLVFISPQGKRLLSYPGAMSEERLLLSLELVKSPATWNLSEQEFAQAILSRE